MAAEIPKNKRRERGKGEKKGKNGWNERHFDCGEKKRKEKRMETF